MNCYFDTSIYNKILEDSHKELIIKKIKKKGLITIPSAINLCEILSTSDENRKNDLIIIYNTVRNNYFPLKPYTWLLKEFVEAVEKGIEKIEVNYPIEVNKYTEDLCRKITSNKGIGLEKYIQGARKYVQEKIKGMKITDEKSFFTYANGKIDFSISLFNSLCQAMGINHNLNREQILEIIQSHSMPWLYFLDAFLYIFYRRPFKSEGYGKRSNPEVADLEQSGYLFWANLFVIKDDAFFSFMKELKQLRGYEKAIMNYAEFKKYLGLTN